MVAIINQIKGSHVTSFNKYHKKCKTKTKKKQKFKPYKGYIFARRINI